MSSENLPSTNPFHDVYVRAKTADDRWASVNAADLDERSFRLFLLNKMTEAGLVVGVQREYRPELRTPLTKEEAEA